MTDVVPDEVALRRARRERALAEMAADEIDILILGREGNARYVSGAPRLWTAGSRPFTPGCVLVRATGDIHLLSTWDEGIPDDIPHENLFGITFNPMNIVPILQGVAGADVAKRVGVDSLTPMFSQILSMAFPDAQLVDGEIAMRRARRIKTDVEVEEIRASVAITERCVDATVAAVDIGVTERRLTSVFMEKMALAGVTTPSSQDIAWITSREHDWKRGDANTELKNGDHLVVAGGVIRGGYTGEIGCTVAVGGGDSKLLEQLEDLRVNLLAACQPGAPAENLIDVYRSAGLKPPPVPIARGLGLGFDLPIISADLPETAAGETLDAGVVCALTSFVWRKGIGGAIAVDPVHISVDGPKLLSGSSNAD